MASIPRFYVYILFRPDGRPFYVGKGQGNRIGVHEKLASKGHKAHRYSIIRKVWSEGGAIVKQKVFETDDQDEAYAMEHYLITSIGRENLANENDGGYGNYGYTPTAETRARLSIAGRGRKLSPETWAKVQAAKVGKPRSAECIAKVRASLTGRKRTPEQIEASAAKQRGRQWSERARQNILEGMRKSTKVRPCGDAHHRTKWLDAQVREVCSMYADGIGPAEIARRLGVSKGSITGLLSSNRARKWLDDGETT